MRILICQLRNHGDIIRTFPLIDAIKYHYQGSYIGFTCFEDMAETCRLCRNIDAVIPQPRFAPVTDTQDGTRILDCSILEKAVQEARDSKFDLYIDLHGVFQSAVFGAMCNIGTRLGRSGRTAKDGAALFYTDVCCIEEKEINRMERHFIVAKKILDRVEPVHIRHERNNVMTIFPGSSRKGILKRWEIEKYIELAERYEPARKVRFVLGPEEGELLEKIRAGCRTEAIAGRSWEEVCGLICESGLVVGNDGAYVHLAVWKHVPAVMICGPLSPVVNGVWKYGSGRTVSVPKHCTCPNVWAGICEFGHRCLREISVQDVADAVEELERTDNG